MAYVTVNEGKLTVKLSSIEKIESLRFSDLEFSLTNLRDLFITKSPFDELSGLRVGTGIPHFIAVGTWYRGKDAIFACIHGEGEAIVVTFENERISKIVVTVDRATELARTIRDEL